MMVTDLEIFNFRGIEYERIELKPLHVFYGPMGSGKTSKLLALLFGLTGSTTSKLTLDEMINLNSDSMVVRVGIKKDGKYYRIERRKKKGYGTVTKFLGEPIKLDLTENIYIEGRQISELFFGAPKEKMFKLDALLGLSDYNLISQELTSAPIDRKLEELRRIKENLKKTLEFQDRLLKVEEEIKEIDLKIENLTSLLKRDSDLKSWADEVVKKASESLKIKGEIESKKELIQNYKTLLESLPKYPENLEEELNILEAKYKAMQRRKSYLEGSFQLLELDSLEKITHCPLCYSPLTQEKINEFKQYYSEYKDLLIKSRELEEELNLKRKEVEQAKKDKERAKWLYSQILNLEAEISSRSFDLINEEDIQKANKILERFNNLNKELETLEIRKRSLEEQRKLYLSLKEEFSNYNMEDIDKKLRNLESLKERVIRLKRTLEEALKEVREEELGRLKDSFRRAFKSIYTYEKFEDVDFELMNYKGKEVLTVKAKIRENWIKADQMSTGEIVALSFALLFSINQLENTPLLLLDEPEEGLDDEGIRGLAKVLKDLSNRTQILLATRNNLLVELLKP